MAADTTATPGFESWEQVRSALEGHLGDIVADATVGTVVLRGHDRPPPPDAPKRGLFRNKPPPPIAIYVQYAAYRDSFSGECVGVAGPELTPEQERELLALGWTAPRTEEALQENWTRDFTGDEIFVAAEMGVASLRILGTTPEELALEVF